MDRKRMPGIYRTIWWILLHSSLLTITVIFLFVHSRHIKYVFIDFFCIVYSIIYEQMCKCAKYIWCSFDDFMSLSIFFISLWFLLFKANMCILNLCCFSGCPPDVSWGVLCDFRERQFQYFLRPEFKYGSDINQSSKECSYQWR